MTLLLKPRRLKVRRRMGLTTVRVRVSNAHESDRHSDIDMTVDSGAIYSVVPSSVLKEIGIEPERTDTFWLADGRSVRRRVGHVRFAIQGRDGISRVIFGRPGDAPLLAALTLESLGLSLDPLKRTLNPLKLMIA